MDELNEILIECAKLRGCYPLMHRTLHQFNWFVGVLIWGWTQYDDYRMERCRTHEDFNEQFWIDQRKEYERIHERWNSAYTCSENDLINEALAFLEYCQEEYNNDDESWEDIITEISNSPEKIKDTEDFYTNVRGIAH